MQAAQLYAMYNNHNALGSVDRLTASNTSVMIAPACQEMSDTFMPDSDKLLIGAHTTSWRGTQGDYERGQVTP